MWISYFWGFKYIILIPLALLVISCATLRPGETKFRLVGEGIASKESGESPEDTLERAKARAKMDVSSRFDNLESNKSIIARQKLAALFPKYADTLLDLSQPLPEPIKKNLYVIDFKEKTLLGEPAIYAYAVLPFAAPNPFLSGTLSLIFPGLGQMNNETYAAGAGYLVLGLLGAGVSGYCYTQYDNWHTKYYKETKSEKIDEYYAKMDDWYKYTQAAVAVYGIIVLYSSIQAYTMARGNNQARRLIRRGGSSELSNMKFQVNPRTNSYLLSLSYEFHQTKRRK